MHIPPMQALRAFEAAARRQSLSRAAEALSLTHGAISHQIKALEAALNVRLIERAGRGIRLTEEGERLAARLRGALAEIEDALREASQRSNPRQLRVSVTPSFAARWLLPRLGRFIAQHKDIDVDVRSNMALIDFRRDDADVAIRHGLGNWPDVKAELLMSDTFFPVCTPRLAARPTRPQELARFTLLRSDDESWKPWFDAVGLDWPEPSRGPIFNDSSLMLQAAAEGQGIALARSTLVARPAQRIARSTVRHRRARPAEIPISWYPPRLAASPKARAVSRVAACGDCPRRCYRIRRREARARHRGASVESEALARSGSGSRASRVPSAGASPPTRTPSRRMRRSSDALQAFARGAPDHAASCVGCVDRLVARDGLEIVEAQLDADRSCPHSLCAADRRASSTHSSVKMRRKLRAVAHRMQVALESRFAADRLAARCG